MKVTIKSDQEPAIVSLKQAVAIKRSSETSLIESPVRDSKSNGMAEVAVKTWAGQVRTIKHHLESRIGRKMPKDCALMTWLIAWGAEVRNRFRVQANGRTNF